VGVLHVCSATDHTVSFLFFFSEEGWLQRLLSLPIDRGKIYSYDEVLYGFYTPICGRLLFND
jgi:hypothetical protein